MSDLTRVDMASALVRHVDVHTRKLLEWIDHLELDPVEVTSSTPLVHPEQVAARPIDGGEEVFWNVELKHAIEDLRSALDYCARDAYERANGPPPPSPKGRPRQIGFPCWGTDPTIPRETREKEFNHEVGSSFGKLARVYPKALDAMRAVQAFVSLDNWWLADLNTLSNEVKHANLIYLTRQNDLVTLSPTDEHPKYRVYGVRAFALTGREVFGFLELAQNRVLNAISAITAALYPSETGSH